MRDANQSPLVTILDDEPEIRQLLTETLEDAGYRTQSFSRARDFEAALKALTERAYPVVHRFGRWSKRGTPWRPTISHRTCWFR